MVLILRFYTLLILALATPVLAIAETVGVFFDANVAQIKFAATDVKTALELKGFKVEMLPLNALNSKYSNKKVVIALSSNNEVTNLLNSEDGTAASGLGSQAYALRTSAKPQKTYWVLGGDVNGAMYGGLQIAENIMFHQFAKTYNSQESPAITRRGIKLNLPLDKESTTYGRTKTSSKTAAIPNVWDKAFWTTWFDEMARNRYNVVSVWSNHPFTSMIKMADYPNVAIQDVTGLDTYRKKMSIDEKVIFWKEIMAYAHSRGFEFFLFNWNIWTDGATGKYGITDDKTTAATNQPTIDYMRKCMSTLWETYPDLDGFGITQGEHMSDNDKNNELFLAKTFGLGTVDYAKNNPKRNIRLIHRWHLANFGEIKENFSELFKRPNINFEMSFKYSLAHMYSTALPQRMSEKHTTPLKEHNLKSHLTVRNDDFFYHNWGDPDFTRAYVNGMVNKGDWFAGFYMGSDGFTQTRTFFSKNSISQGKLEVQRQWYMFKLWGRLSYNPKTDDAVFKDFMTQKYPNIPSQDLFTAWQKASRGLTSVGELITGTLGRDNQWWPEACQSIDSFLTVKDFIEAKPDKGSMFCSISETGENKCGKKKSAFNVADDIETDAKAALLFANSLKMDANTEGGVTINNIKAMSYLAIYYAYKIRGATYLKANDKEKAKNALGTAYCQWMNYANLMDAMYTGMTMARSLDLPDWHTHDRLVLKEYTDLGGFNTPSCEK
jgi:hypothetical protein